jgi:hypothetical protein
MQQTANARALVLLSSARTAFRHPPRRINPDVGWCRPRSTSAVSDSQHSRQPCSLRGRLNETRRTRAIELHLSERRRPVDSRSGAIRYLPAPCECARCARPAPECAQNFMTRILDIERHCVRRALLRARRVLSQRGSPEFDRVLARRRGEEWIAAAVTSAIAPEPECTPFVRHAYVDGYGVHGSTEGRGLDIR